MKIPAIKPVTAAISGSLIEDQINAAKRINEKDFHLLDVRKKSEYDSEHVVNAENAPLDFINESIELIETLLLWFDHLE